MFENVLKRNAWYIKDWKDEKRKNKKSLKKVLTRKEEKIKIKIEQEFSEKVFGKEELKMNLIKNRNEVITYSINKNINNSCSISVQGGEVTVMAPWYFTQNRIQEMVEEKRAWILKKLEEYENTKVATLDEDKSRVQLLGQTYQVELRYKMVNVPEVNLEGRSIKITVPNKYRKMDSNAMLDALLEKMYGSIAEKEIERAMEKTRIMLGFAPEDFQICKMKNVLGKCTQEKTIIINPEIVKYSRETIEYVVLHEYCHLKYKNHSKYFYREMAKYMPNYKIFQNAVSNYQY